MPCTQRRIAVGNDECPAAPSAGINVDRQRQRHFVDTRRNGNADALALVEPAVGIHGCRQRAQIAAEMGMKRIAVVAGAPVIDRQVARKIGCMLVAAIASTRAIETGIDALTPALEIQFRSAT